MQAIFRETCILRRVRIFRYKLLLRLAGVFRFSANDSSVEQVC